MALPMPDFVISNNKKIIIPIIMILLCFVLSGILRVHG